MSKCRIRTKKDTSEKKKFGSRKTAPQYNSSSLNCNKKTAPQYNSNSLNCKKRRAPK